MAAKKALTIGIVDGLFLSLQERLLNEGHTVKVYLPGLEFAAPISGEQFNPTPSKNSKNMHHVLSVEGLLDCDFVICETLNREDVYSLLHGYGIPMIGYSPEAVLMETNRGFAEFILKKSGIVGGKHSPLHKPETREFDSLSALKTFLKGRRNSMVFKQSSRSPQGQSSTPTMVFAQPKDALPVLDVSNAWFKEGAGGCFVEEFISGQEVCFGAWFDGTAFVGKMYSCIEHKGAQNYGRGGVMTGEVGTTIKMHDIDETTNMGRAFRMLEPHIQGKLVGLVDMNTIIDAKGKQWFLEFTMRFGRPTIDALIAHLRPQQDFGRFLYNVVHRVDNKEDAFRMGETVAVTVFTYGMPVIDTLLERLPNDIQEKVYAAIPKMYVDPPKTKCKAATILQFLAPYDHARKQYRLADDGRNFIVCGHGSTSAQARDNAYDALAEISIPGCTWRDDIGNNLEELHRAFDKHRIV